MKKRIVFNNIEYELINNYKDGYDESAISEKINDIEYFNIYDYIVGDWSYGKLRLKGFCDKDNKAHSNINSYNNFDQYIKNYCSFECRYFVLKRIK